MFYYRSLERQDAGPFNPRWDSTVGGQSPLYHYGPPNEGPVPQGAITPDINMPGPYGTGLRSWGNIPKPGTGASGFIGGLGAALYKALSGSKGLGLDRTQALSTEIEKDNLILASIINEAYAAANTGDCLGFGSVMQKLEQFFIDRRRDPLSEINAIFDQNQDLQVFYNGVMSDVSMGGTEYFCAPAPISPPPPGPAPAPIPSPVDEGDPNALLMRQMEAEQADKERQQNVEDLEARTANAIFNAQAGAEEYVMQQGEQPSAGVAVTAAPPQTAVQTGPTDLPADYPEGEPQGSTGSSETGRASSEGGGMGMFLVGSAIIAGVMYYMDQN